jgi:hypothetical protein
MLTKRLDEGELYFFNLYNPVQYGRYENLASVVTGTFQKCHDVSVHSGDPSTAVEITYSVNDNDFVLFIYADNIYAITRIDGPVDD